jgi:hypothetical protein
VVGSTAIYWSLVPLAGIAGLAAAGRRWPDTDTVDRFFAGYRPWLLLLIGLAAYGSTPQWAIGSPAAFRFWGVAAGCALLWSGWIDYRFFGSLRKLALHRAVSWTLIAIVLVGSSLYVEIAQRLGL